MNTITFWQLLKDNKIVIPIVQRDYAQGRADQVRIRKRFLKSLIMALDGEKDILLDYVFGNQENAVITPLDGQQRLTTLWLLHWYIAMRLDLIQTDSKVRDTLLRFTYETRVSSSDFCESLCCEKITNISDIEDELWFYSNYSNEPTISSMLRMLKGTGVNDGIDEVLLNKDLNSLKSYWEILTKHYEPIEKAPISFYYFPLEKYKLTDDLYIKMNARGKALTGFENFKADLLDHVKRVFVITEKDNIGEEDVETKASIRKVEFASKMDNAWTDIFWKFRTESDLIDDIYIAFINRFLLNYLMVSDLSLSADAWEKNLQEGASSNFGKKLYRDELVFDDFDFYAKHLDDTKLKALEYCLDCVASNITNLDSIKLLCAPRWEDYGELEENDFSFIPKYKKTIKDNGVVEYKVAEITLQERISFFAICCYLEQGEYEQDTFKDWMRVVWNLIQNIDSHYSVSVLVSGLRQINKLKTYSHNVLSFLQDVDIDNENVIVYSAIKEQINEEKVKAKKILSETNSEEWKKRIIEAENSLFFRGAIRFLFQDDNCQEDWSQFDKKLSKAKECFNKDGELQGNNILLRTFISFFDDWNNHFQEIYYDNSKSYWRGNLLNSNLAKPVSLLLSGNKCDFKSYVSSFGKSQNPYEAYIQEFIVKTQMLDTIVEDSYLHWRGDWCGGVWALHPYNTKANWKIYFLHQRNNILCKCKDILLNEDMERYRENGICWGKDIKFKYKDRYFSWTNENKVHRMDKNGNKIIKSRFFDGCKPWEKLSPQEFKNQLDSLMN